MRRAVFAAMFLLASSAAYGGWLGLMAVNNSTPPDGFLLDGSAGNLTTPYPGKIFAR